MLFTSTLASRLPSEAEALPGRSEAMPVVGKHVVLGTSLTQVPEHAEVAYVALGCFWGAERVFWKLDGVISTAVGYGGGVTKNPTYREVCSGKTGHTELVRVAYDPNRITYGELLRVFWESHDPTQGFRQGNDRGTQYRSAIYTTSDSQLQAAQGAARVYGEALAAAGKGEITTEIAPCGAFYFAEDEHQQYLAKNPGGYCGIGGTGVSCLIG